MNNQDRDLILDLVADRLGQQEAEAALARVSADSDLSASYAEQLSVHLALTDADAVTMTASESSLLRASLAEKLNLADRPAVMRSRPRQARSWWKPAAGFAGAAAVVVVTAVIVLPGSMSSNDTADSAVASAPLTANTSNTSTTEAAAELGSQESDLLAATIPTDGGAEFDASDDDLTVVWMRQADAKSLLEATQGKVSPATGQDFIAADGYANEISINRFVVDHCLESVMEEFPAGATTLLLGADDSRASIVVFVGVDEGSGIETVISVDLADCSIVDQATELDLIED